MHPGHLCTHGLQAQIDEHLSLHRCEGKATLVWGSECVCGMGTRRPCAEDSTSALTVPSGANTSVCYCEEGLISWVPCKHLGAPSGFHRPHFENWGVSYAPGGQ